MNMYGQYVGPDGAVWDPIKEEYETGPSASQIHEAKNRKASAAAAASAAACEHNCGPQCQQSCQYTPEKSAIYHKINAAYKSALSHSGVAERNGRWYNGTYEKIFDDGIQFGDWVYYTKDGDILSSEIYRKGIPVQNHAYYPNGKAACVMSFNPKTDVFRMILFDPIGNRVFTGCRTLSLPSARGSFELLQEWHPTGHLLSEAPVFRVHDYASHSLFTKGDTGFGVKRVWHINGSPKSEEFLFEHKTLFSRKWNGKGEIICKWECNGSKYSELRGDSYGYILNGHEYKNIEWNGNTYPVRPQLSYYKPEDKKSFVSYRIMGKWLVKTCFVDDKLMDLHYLETNVIKYGFDANVTPTNMKSFRVYNGNTYVEYSCINGLVHGMVTMYDGRMIKSVITYNSSAKAISSSLPVKMVKIMDHNYLQPINGILDGVSKQYVKGSLVSLDTYVSGYKNGDCTTWIADTSIVSNWKYDVLLSRIHYKGKKIIKREIVSGTSTEITDENNGIIVNRYFLVNGRLQGKHTAYYPDGSVKSTTMYLNGVRNGPENMYLNNGNVVSVKEFINGLVMLEKAINNVGKVIKTRQYKAGKPMAWQHT